MAQAERTRRPQQSKLCIVIQFRKRSGERPIPGVQHLRYMAIATRLISYAEVDTQPSHPEQVSIAVRHELELADGCRVLLLNDRGWGSTGTWAELSLKEIQENARTVVGPDWPPEGLSHEYMAQSHWAYIQRIAQQQGVFVDADELRQLPHDVVPSDRLLAKIGHRT